jgi:hypothetical protein
MSDTPTPNLRRIRTFAEDVRSVRNQGDSSQVAKSAPTAEFSAAPSKPPTSTEVTPTAAAVGSFADVPRQAEHIPSFHELQKKTVSAPTPVLESVTKNSTGPHKPTVTVRARTTGTKPATSSSGGATIITDRSTNKIGFVGGIIQALKSWWRAQKHASAKKKIPTYAVADVERRKGVVQKATSKTGTIFTADNETLKEEIRRRGGAPIPKPAHNEPDISWSPNTEVGLPLLSGTTLPVAPHNVQVTFKKTTAPNTISEPALETAPAKSPTPTPATQTASLGSSPKEARWSNNPTPPAHTLPPNKIPEPVFVAPATAEPLPISPLVAEPEALEEPLPSQGTEMIGDTSAPRLSIGKLIPPIRLTTNRLTYSITGAIVLIVVLGVGAKFAVGQLMNSKEVIPLPPATSLVKNAVVIDHTIMNPTKEELINSIQTNSDKTTKELRYIDRSGELVKTSTVLSLVGFGESRNFNQTVTDVRLITLGGSRGIVVKVADPTTALGALLNFEPSIVTSLATTLAISDTSAGEFIDKALGIADARVTASSDGVETLVYGFIDRDTIIFTKSTADFLSFLGNR